MSSTLDQASDWDFGRGLRGYSWKADASRGNVLLQHGYAEHAGRYVDHHARLIPNLLRQGLSVYAFDMRGHGLSPGARAVTDIDEAVEDHRAARRAMRSEKLPILLFGHSLGGLVTAASVTREPADISGVVLSSPALLVRSNAASRLGAKLLNMVVPGFRMMPPQSPEGLSRIPAEVQAFIRDDLVYNGRMPAKLAASALSISRRGWTRYTEWSAPTLVIHGTADTFTDVRGSELFVSMIRSEDKALITVDGGRHELLNDLERDEVRAKVVGWMVSRSAAT